MMAELLELQLGAQKDPYSAPACTCLCTKAMLQAAMDNGSWENASLLVPMGDPLEKMELGGDEDELEAIHSYRKSMKELKTKLVVHSGGGNAAPAEEAAGADGEAGGGKGGGWRGGKKKGT